jgi:hypothetical protein
MKVRLILPLLLLIAGCSQHQKDVILLEAEGFENKGGWFIDQQFMDQMGSPYLLAHGLGKQVEDALTTFVIPDTGEYQIFARTFNWVAPWTANYSPGEFQVLINDHPLDITFGKEGTEWSWIYGGSVNLNQTENTIALHDLTGFDGRCDAIVIARDKNIELPDQYQELLDFRRKWLDLPDQPVSKGEYDLVVAGGGMAGICSAISAARLGLQVALIQNRPVLGGNNSSEIRVHLMGNTDKNHYPDIGKVVRELDTGDPGNAGPAEAYGDRHKLNLVRQEKNIKLFLNMHVFDAEILEGMIKSVTAKNIETNEEFIFYGKWFSDCTGDGNLGYLAGADFAYGREGQNETRESMAPESADDMTMGSSNLWYASKKETLSEFPELPWAVQFSDEYYLDQTRADWRWESGYFKNTIEEAEYIRDLNLRAVYGNWSYLKNNLHEKYGLWELDWVAYIAGKRESRRLLGDVILQQQDLQERTEFPDACVTTTWGIDLHYADSLNSMYYPGDEFYSWFRHPEIEPYEIPYRCLYSRNIDNLFMAGRCISVTHVALGTIRVMRTGGMMGEVVGMAASLCKELKVNPGDVYENHLDELIRLFMTGVQKNE